MTSILNNLTSEKQLSTTVDGLVSSSSSEKIFLGNVTFTNTSSSIVEITLWRIATASTATEGSGGNWFIKQKIAAGKIWECRELESHVLGNSMSVFGKADISDVVNVDISGVTEV